MNVESAQTLLNELNDGMGKFAPQSDKDDAVQKSYMLEAVNKVEPTVKRSESSEAFRKLGYAFYLLGSWYYRGEEKKEPLQTAVAYLMKAVEIGDNKEAAIELSRMLIEEKLVRDLDTALTLTEKLKAENAFPSWLDAAEAKAKRWTGQYDGAKLGNDFSSLSPTPAVLREERTALRRALTAALKAKREEESTVLALRLYNLGLLVAYLYGNFDGTSGVDGRSFDSAESVFKQVAKKFNFSYKGRIKGAGFLSDTDYTRIEKALGDSSGEITLDKIRQMI